MTMIIPFQDDLPLDESFTESEAFSLIRLLSISRKPKTLHLIDEKIRMPDIKSALSRPRFNDLLKRSKGHFVASLISGRSRTGKTWAAADFAATCKKVAWYTVDSSDTDWNVFSHYFSASIVRTVFGRKAKMIRLSSEENVSQNGMSDFLIDLFTRTTEKLKEREMMVVLDDVHHVFDADWFGDFFNLLLYSLPPRIHLLILCRTKPRLPLWRLRSKQLLNVLDEKALAFDVGETEEFCKLNGISQTEAKQVYRNSYGRIGNILDLLYLDVSKTRGLNPPSKST